MINEYYAKKFCKDDISKIENYDKAIADTTQTWDLHHRLELTLDGEFALSREQLKMHDMYYNRPYYELIFLTHAEHRRLHMQNMSEDTRRKMSEAKKGQLPWNIGKHPTDETKRKISEANKGHTVSDETRRKMSEAKKNMSEDTRRKISEANKGKHPTDETRRKLSEAAKRRWARKLDDAC